MGHRVDQRQVLGARIAEDDLDALALQASPEDARTRLPLARRMPPSHTVPPLVRRYLEVPRKTKSPRASPPRGPCRALLGYTLAHGTPESRDPQDQNRNNDQ